MVSYRRLFRVLFLVSIAVVGGVGYGAYWAVNRVNQLRSLQLETQATLTEAYRLLVSTEAVSATAERLGPFFDRWQQGLRATGEGIRGVTTDPLISTLGVDERAASVRIGWDSASTLFADATEQIDRILSGELSGIITPTGIDNMLFQVRQRAEEAMDAGRDAEIAFLRTLERRMHNGTVNLQYFVTQNLQLMTEEIERETTAAVRQTIRVTTAAVAVLLLAAVASLLAGARLLERANETLEDRVRRRTRSIQSLLDFSGQGFLSFGSDFLVRPEWSRECAGIFGRDDITGEDVSALLFAGQQDRDEFRDAVSLVFAGSSSPEVVFDLIDSRITIEGRSIQLEFRQIDDETVMCSLADVTEQERLAQEVVEETELRELLLSVVEHRSDFIALMRESREVLTALEDTRDGVVPDTTVRMLHTFKANAAFVKFQRTADAAHQLEQDITDAQLLSDTPPLAEGLDRLRAAFEKDIAIVEEHLGSEYVSIDTTVIVPRRKIDALEAALQAAGINDDTVERRLRELQTVRLSTMAMRLNSLARDLAEQRGKRMAPVILDVDDAAVAPQVYRILVDSLTHIVRNMVDHGIERPRSREEAGKEAQGHILISADEDHHILRVSISDDGAGIDVDAVRRRARERGMIGSDEQLDGADIVRLIFRDGFSTSHSVSALSGRGEGLAAVRALLRSIGGRISLSTRRGQGTRFVLTVPRYLEEQDAS